MRARAHTNIADVAEGPKGLLVVILQYDILGTPLPGVMGPIGVQLGPYVAERNGA
jgi:hypothetical protein